MFRDFTPPKITKNDQNDVFLNSQELFKPENSLIVDFRHHSEVEDIANLQNTSRQYSGKLSKQNTTRLRERSFNQNNCIS